MIAINMSDISYEFKRGSRIKDLRVTFKKNFKSFQKAKIVAFEEVIYT